MLGEVDQGVLRPFKNFGGEEGGGGVAHARAFSGKCLGHLHGAFARMFSAQCLQGFFQTGLTELSMS